MATADLPDFRDATPEPGRAPAHEQDVEAHQAWRELVRGGQCVVEHGREGPMHLLVTRPAGTGRSGGQGLTKKEMQTAIGRARGVPIKELACDLDLTHSVVGHCLVNALRKLRIRSEAELVALFGAGPASVLVCPPMPEFGWPVSMPRGLRARRVLDDGAHCLVLTYPAPRWSLPDRLTHTEGAVVRALIDGLRPEEIACARGIAPRTVANQLASVYRKMNVHSRVELFAVLRGA